VILNIIVILWSSWLRGFLPVRWHGVLPTAVWVKRGDVREGSEHLIKRFSPWTCIYNILGLTSQLE